MDRKIQEDQIAELNKIIDGRHYRPISKISYGSYGQIFRITSTDTGIDYALKVISKEKMIKQQKLHEAIIQHILLGKFRHPGIVKYIQSIQTTNYISHVIQLCPYGDMNNMIKKVDKDIEMVLHKKQIIKFYLAQIVQALDFIHQEKIIHRDLKLENILVGPDLNCRIIDFGTAKALESERTFTKSQIQFIDNIRKKYKEKQMEDQMVRERNQSFVGSANYLAPQSINLNYTLKSDIWAFGVLAYKMFHGKLPFSGQNNYEIFSQIKGHQSKENLEINGNLDKPIQDLIKSCLKNNPDDRPTTQQLKKHTYFQNINWSEIYSIKSPLNPKALETSQPVQINIKKTQFEMKLQKKMFLGNYKPRILKMYPSPQSKKLYMSYWYLDGKVPKNQFQLKMCDYAQKISKNQFTVVNGDVRYTFRIQNQSNTQKTVDQINNIIKDHYQ